MEHEISIPKTARYFTYGNPDSAQNIWFVLHGYGQLPYYFIRKFNTLDPEKNFIVAPEGFHRFYREGTKGRVGASWMTKEARLDDIKDNIEYLNLVATEILKKHSFQQRFLVGFSQGGATASRWHHNGNYKADHFILWASIFADDISFEDDKFGMLQSNNFFIIGDEDPYFKNKTDEIQAFLKRQPFHITIKNFRGKHDIDSTTLHEIATACENHHNNNQ